MSLTATTARRRGPRGGLLALSLLLPLLPAAVRAGEPLAGSAGEIRRNAVHAGGARMTGAANILLASAGEAVVSSFTGAGSRLYSGMAHLAAQPGTITSIVAVAKATGTIELAWTAPGTDGFTGALSGFYRIDYSSETGHVFAPTTFKVEFATNVQPNDPQAYTLTGLEANTTYFARIYLADARKVVAETSDPSEESTLARLPVSPVLSGVFFSSVSFTWAVPADGTEGYDIDASSTNFGTLFPGGVVVSSRTREGLSVTLSVIGLDPGTTYYFKLGSLNWQDERNFATIIATRTRDGSVLPIENLAAAADARARTALFTWTNPAFPNPAGVLVQVSTNPITDGPTNGGAFPAGTIFADGSVVETDSAADNHLRTGLELDTTYYYRFFSKNTANVFSVFVSTELMIDLPPMAPAGMTAGMTPDGSSITITWAGVSSNLDGSPFRAPASPLPLELTHFDVYRATGITRANWVWVDSAAAAATAWTGGVPVSSETYFWKVVAQDSLGVPDVAMIADNAENIYSVGPDQISRLKIPAALTGTLPASGNKYGKPLLVRAVEKSAQVGGKVVKSVEFGLLQSPDGAAAADVQFAAPEVDVRLRYEIAGGQVVASAYSPEGTQTQSALTPAINAGEAAEKLGGYWNNGQDYVKVFGKVDTGAQTLNVKTAMAGDYQIRSLLRPGGFVFDVSQVSNKAITPNGDGLNDYVLFQFDNPRDSGFSGQIYDVRGALVAEMKRSAQVADGLTWDGKADGRVVPRGVYIYQIKAEDQVFNGTIVVIR